MMSKFRASRERDERGFTLIELLVVILIIAILAAIAIPVFLNQRQKGWEAQLKSALKNSTTAAESYNTGPGNGSYVGLDGAGGEALLVAEGFKKSTDVTALTVTASATAYCVQAGHTNLSGVTMVVSSADATPTTGTCAAAGVKS